MKFTSTIAALSLAAGAFATPLLRGQMPAEVEERDLEVRHTSTKSQFHPTPVLGCLLPYQATNIVNAFNYLLANPKAANFKATANALFADDFTDTSDSINQLAGIPEGSVTFANKADFITQSSAQPPLVLQTLDIFNGCKAISWRWISVSGAGNDNEAVKGIDNFYINYKGQIESTYAEFNSGAWLANLGYPECSSTATAATSTATS